MAENLNSRDYREQIQLAVRAGLELGAPELHVRRSDHSATLLPFTRRNEREPGEKETGALGKHSRRATNHAHALPGPSQIPRNERQRLALVLMNVYLNRNRAIWG